MKLAKIITIIGALVMTAIIGYAFIAAILALRVQY